MHIAFLIRSLQPAGAERQLTTLARGLRAAGHRVTVYVFYAADSPLERELVGSGVALVSLAKSGRWDVLGFMWRLARALRRDRPDLLHGYLVTSNLLVTLMAPWVRSPATVWGVRASGMDLGEYDWLARVDFRLSCWWSRFPDLIISNSQAGRAHHVANGYPAGRVVVVSNGIDTEHFTRRAEARAALRREWDVPQDALLIGQVGRLDPMKDYPVFLRAARLLRETRPDARFVCVGGGPPLYRAALEQLSVDLGLSDCVRWAGPRGDLPEVYSTLDLLTLASAWGEGFSNVLAEAMACEVPVVATDVGDATAIAGAHGAVVPAGDPVALATAWQRVLAAADPSAGARRRAHIVEHFSTSRLVRTTEALLAEVVERRRR